MRIRSELNALGRFGTGLSQNARLITLAHIQDSGISESLVAEYFAGYEAINGLYRFDVDALSVSTDRDLTTFIGTELTIGLLQPDGSRRAWHGLCTAASWLGADGGMARYRLCLEPALALLALRRDSYIFQDKDVRDIITELLADYPQIRFDFDLTQSLMLRPVCTQYRESDLEFFIRLLASEGLSWRFEHDSFNSTVGAYHGQSCHRLVIFDGQAQAPTMPGGDLLRFHGVRATELDDAIDVFRARRKIAANAISISSWDPAELVAPAAEQQSNLDAGDIPDIPIYDGSGERIAAERRAAEQHSRLLLQALEQDNKLFEGSGAVRRLAAGHAFQLTQHAQYPDGANIFAVIWVRHEARNNVRSGIARAEQSNVEDGTYRNTFACVRNVVPLLPLSIALPHPCTAR